MDSAEPAAGGSNVTGLPVTPSLKRRHRGRILLFLLLAVVVLALGALFGASWYFSDQLLDVTHTADSYNLSVLSRSLNTVTLTRTAVTAREGVYGLYWPGGHSVIGDIRRLGSSSSTRVLLRSAPGLRAGMHARADVFVYSSPTDVNLHYRNVIVRGRLGPMPAWFVPGVRRTWVIAVHGYTSNRAEAIRPMPTLTRLGFPVLDVSYRNDSGDPPSPDHLYHLGASEWLDLESAARYARSHGASGFVFYGYSMGGNIVESFLHRSSYARYSRAVILDSPALDWSMILDRAAQNRRLPGFLAATTSRVVAWRLGMFSLDPIDQLTARGGVFRRTLLFHCTGDTLVPVRSSDIFAREHGAYITYVRVPGCDHTQAWNVNPGRYDSALDAFLTHVGAP